MDRPEAERIYDAGQEVVVETLLSFDARIRELEQIVAGLTKNSSNSSRPPSSDPPWNKKEPSRKPPSKRKQGGQPGHKGKKRELLPPEMVAKSHDLFPEQCSCCHLPLAQELQIPSPNPLRHQVTDLPKIVPITTEYRCHSTLCSCGNRTVATLPGEVAQSEFGPGIHAVIAYLMAAHRVTRRGVTEIMGSVFGISISTGAVCNVAKRVSEASIPVVGIVPIRLAQVQLIPRNRDVFVLLRRKSRSQQLQSGGSLAFCRKSPLSKIAGIIKTIKVNLC